MGISDAYTLFENAFTNTIVFNLDWIISLVLTVFILLIITRNVEKWKTLGFPVMLALHIAGITPNFIIYLIAGITFAIENVSLGGLGNTLVSAFGSISDPTGEKSDYRRAVRRERRGHINKEVKSIFSGNYKPPKNSISQTVKEIVNEGKR